MLDHCPECGKLICLEFPIHECLPEMYDSEVQRGNSNTGTPDKQHADPPDSSHEA